MMRLLRFFSQHPDVLMLILGVTIVGVAVAAWVRVLLAALPVLP